MELEPISTTRMIALMIAGGLFACVGLYLMVRPKPQGSAKIEIFGLKFESSSAGLLVFLTGAGFLAITIFVPEKQGALAGDDVAGPVPPIAVQPDVTKPKSPTTPLPAQGAQVAPVPITTANLIAETEPNDAIRDAMPLALGQTVTGRVERDNRDKDWYVVTLPDGGLTGYEIRLFHANGSGSVMANVYNARQEKIGSVESRDGAKYLALEGRHSDRLYFQLSRHNFGAWAEYELSLVSGSGD